MEKGKKVKVIRPFYELQNEIPKLKVCAYCRVSTELKEQDTSYLTQQQYYEDLINSNLEWELVKIYADKGSGSSTGNRVSFNEMLYDCECGKIDLIITKSISRFARNTLDTIKISRDLKEKGIYIIFEKENINTQKNESDIAFNLMAWFSQMESESISNNIKLSFRNRFKKGEHINYKLPYGYVKDENKKFTIVEEEAELVKKVFKMYLDGISIYKISQHLKEQNILTRENNNWYVTTLRTMLTNDFYIGTMTLQKVVNIKPKVTKVNNGYAPKYIYRNNHEAIISEVDFEQVNKKILENKKQKYDKRKARENIIFTGKVICLTCDERLQKVKRTSRKAKYMCKKCFLSQVRIYFLEEKFIELRNELVSNYERILKIEVEEDDVKILELENKILDIKKQIDILYRLKKDNVIDSAIFIEKNNLLTNEISIIEEQIKHLKQSYLDKNLIKLINYLESLNKVQEMFIESEFENIIEKIMVEPEKVVFVLKNGYEFEYRNFYTVNETRIRYGYRKVNGKYIINHYEMKVLNLIFDEYIDGKSIVQIKELLEEKELLTKRGMTKWLTPTIRSYLYNEKYLGTEVYPQLISNEKFALVQEIYLKKKKGLS